MDNECACCENEPAVGYAAVPGMPLTIAWGMECLNAGVVPYDLLVTHVAIGPVHTGYEAVIERTLEYFGKTQEEFDAAVQNVREDMDDDGEV